MVRRFVLEPGIFRATPPGIDARTASQAQCIVHETMITMKPKLVGVFTIAPGETVVIPVSPPAAYHAMAWFVTPPPTSGTFLYCPMFLRPDKSAFEVLWPTGSTVGATIKYVIFHNKA